MSAVIATSTMSALRVEFVTDLPQLEALAQPWETLNRTATDHDAPFFQSFPWSYHVARVRLERSPHRFKLLVASLWRGTELVGIWPLSLQRSAGAWIARSLDDPFGQFAGVAFASANDIKPGVAAIVHQLKQEALADGLQIEALVAGSHLHAALLNLGASINEANHAVYVDLRACATIKDFRQNVNAKTRKNLRNLRNRLERTHGLAEHVIEERAQVGALIDQTFAERQRWMARFGRTSPAFRDGDFAAVLTGLAVASGINLLGFSLTTEEAIASAQWGFVYLGRYYAYLSAKNPDYDEYSPGRMHLGMVIEACLTRGIKFLELMAPASDYKLDWTDRTKRLDSASLPITLKGRIAIYASAAMGAPWARRLSRALPQSARKALIRRLSRN